MDYIVRATAADAQIRAFAATTRNLTEHTRQVHNTSPVVTAALGRLMTGAVMMGKMLKGEDDLLTLQIKCSGPIQGLAAFLRAERMAAQRSQNAKEFGRNFSGIPK